LFCLRHQHVVIFVCCIFLLTSTLVVARSNRTWYDRPPEPLTDS
jgi:hypothetical protein